MPGIQWTWFRACLGLWKTQRDPLSNSTPQLGWQVRNHGDFGSEPPSPPIDIILRLITFRISAFPVSRNLRSFFVRKRMKLRPWVMKSTLRVTDALTHTSEQMKDRGYRWETTPYMARNLSMKRRSSFPGLAPVRTGSTSLFEFMKGWSDLRKCATVLAERQWHIITIFSPPHSFSPSHTCV